MHLSLQCINEGHSPLPLFEGHTSLHTAYSVQLFHHLFPLYWFHQKCRLGGTTCTHGSSAEGVSGIMFPHSSIGLSQYHGIVQSFLTIICKLPAWLLPHALVQAGILPRDLLPSKALTFPQPASPNTADPSQLCQPPNPSRPRRQHRLSRA